jgi:hypothetical protein
MYGKTTGMRPDSRANPAEVIVSRPGATRPSVASSPGGRRPAGTTLVEMLIVVALFSLVMCVLFWLFGFGGQATRRITPKLSVQATGRKAVARFLQDLQEGMDVITPKPGSTLAYAVVRDKVAALRWYYLVQKGQDETGMPLYQLWSYTNDPSLPKDRRYQQVLDSVMSISFTSRSEGALQINLLLSLDGIDYALLTTVRLRNLASAEMLW